MRKPEEINSARMRYGFGGPYCIICGQPTDSVAIRCERCLESIRHGEELQHAERWLRGHPETLIEVGHDKKKRIHLVLFRAPYNVAWCGEPVSQKRENRKLAQRGMFPAGICEQCIEVYEGLAL